MSPSGKILERISETLMIGFAVFLILIAIDRMSHTTYFRDSSLALFGISVILIAPVLLVFHHLLKSLGNRQDGERASG